MEDPVTTRPHLDSILTRAQSEWTSWRDIDAVEWPAVSVILPAGDSDEDLDHRLPAAVRQTLNPHEVLVVDISSDGRHLSTVARFDQAERRTVVRYVRSPLLGHRALRQLVARLVAGNVEAFAWSGATLSPTWVESIAASVRQLCATAVPRA